ncbi:MAG TPA: hypothetical protein VIF61_09040 [Methylocystis sp.]|jgi:hypothetical protein
MSRHSIILSGLAVASFLALGTAPGRADADVDGTDHSKLNHGVLGKAPLGAQAVAAPAAATQQVSFDKDVTGTDHSKLNHGVLGLAPAGAAVAAAAPAAAPAPAPASATWAAPSK